MLTRRKVLQAHAIQVQTLQNEFESLKAQLANLKIKSFQPVNHAQLVQGSSGKDLLGRFIASHTTLWLGNMFF
jgi:hypothetical protein